MTETRKTSLNISNRRIGTQEMKIGDFVRRLMKGEFLIPSFQRDFVWEAEDIIKLWDSIYRFYPIGSILYWRTELYLNIHRKLGGCILGNERDRKKDSEQVYILDGQQRATSLLVSLYGRKTMVRGRESFDYSLYFDAATGSFFFAKDLNKRRREVNETFLFRLGDVLKWAPEFHKEITGQAGFIPEVGKNLHQLGRMFSDYPLSFICIEGFDIPAVREIYERINQEGRELNSMDLMIARTFQNYAYMVEDDL